MKGVLFSSVGGIPSPEQQAEKQILSVMFYYSPTFAKVTFDPKGYVEGLVNSANLAYNNSDIPLEMRAFCVEEWVGFVETRSPVQMIMDFPYARGN